MQPRNETVVLAEGSHIRLVKRGRWEYAQRRNVTGIVGIVALTNDDKIVLVEQYRPPIEARAIELPAGLVGDEVTGESLESAAKRELLEETGYTAEQWSVLVTGVTSPGITDEYVTLFLARGLHREGSAQPDETERIILHEVPVREMKDRLRQWSGQGKRVNFMVHAGLFMISG
jgi:ADP-ribose pyrophosphatase